MLSVNMPAASPRAISPDAGVDRARLVYPADISGRAAGSSGLRDRLLDAVDCTPR